MPMRRRPEPTISVNMRVPETLLAEVRVLLTKSDGSVPYGAFSRLFTSLLRDWVNSRKVAIQ